LGGGGVVVVRGKIRRGGDVGTIVIVIDEELEDGMLETGGPGNSIRFINQNSNDDEDEWISICNHGFMDIWENTFTIFSIDESGVLLISYAPPNFWLHLDILSFVPRVPVPHHPIP
jgi:hypothetical protein